MSQEVFILHFKVSKSALLVNYSYKHGIYGNPKTNFLLDFSNQVREVGPNNSPGNLCFDWKQIATVLIFPQCNSMMYLK